jgi:hypothetical protein
MIDSPRITFQVSLWIALTLAAGIAAPRINVRAQQLARHLGPSRLSDKSDNGADIAAIRKRAVPILEALENTYRTSGPSPESLMASAYDFRKDVGPYERMVTTQILIAAWKEASAMGLFDQDRKFKDKIGDGRFAGKPVVFEHIIPGDKYAAGSTHLANFRIVAPERKREKASELSNRDKAFGNQLAKVVKEIESGKQLVAIETSPELNAVGQTAEEAKKRWQAEVELAGEAVNEEPNIKVRGRVTATPSHMSKYRWRITGAVHNLSSHPTSVELNYWLIGITDEKRDHYLMIKGTKKMDLRKGEDLDFTLYTKSKGSYKKNADDHDELTKEERKYSRVRCRGFLLQVVHATGEVDVFASDQHLEGYIDEEDDLKIGSLRQF